MGRSPRAAALLVVGALLQDASWAHDGLGQGQSTGSGALHLLGAPLAWVALAGLLAAVAGVNRSIALRCAVMAAAAACVAAARPALLPPLLPSLLAALIGLAGVVRVPPRARVAVPLSLAAGLVAGAATGLDQADAPALLGAGLSMLLIAGVGLAGCARLQRVRHFERVLPIARRVLAAWVAAIALLMLALAVRTAAG